MEFLIDNQEITKWNGEVLVYDSTWKEIQEQDWPDRGTVFIVKADKKSNRNCLIDHENSDCSWLVIARPEATDIHTVGIFGRKDHAEIFAHAFAARLK